jgi:hypothetical protein
MCLLNPYRRARLWRAASQGRSCRCSCCSAARLQPVWPPAPHWTRRWRRVRLSLPFPGDAAGLAWPAVVFCRIPCSPAVLSCGVVQHRLHENIRCVSCGPAGFGSLTGITAVDVLAMRSSIITRPSTSFMEASCLQRAAGALGLQARCGRTKPSPGSGAPSQRRRASCCLRGRLQPHHSGCHCRASSRQVQRLS